MNRILGERMMAQVLEKGHKNRRVKDVYSRWLVVVFTMDHRLPYVPQLEVLL